MASKVRLPRSDELEDGRLARSLIPAADKLFDRARFGVGEIEKLGGIFKFLGVSVGKERFEMGF